MYSLSCVSQCPRLYEVGEVSEVVRIIMPAVAIDKGLDVLGRDGVEWTSEHLKMGNRMRSGG